MSRTYRRKNKPFYNTMEDYTTPSSWLTCKGLAVGEKSYYKDLRVFHGDSKYEGRHYSANLKEESRTKRRTDEKSILNIILRDEEYEPVFKPFKRYSNIWDWD